MEVKAGECSLSDSLRYFQGVTRAAHAFQVVVDRPYVDVDCLSRAEPVIVPARTLLSQLL